MITTYQELIDTLQIIALSGNSVIQDFGVGWAWDINTKVHKYPCMWVDNTTHDHSYQVGKVVFVFDIYVFDLIYADKSNEKYILSDTTRAGIDFINTLRDNYTTYGFWIDKDFGEIINFIQFTEKWDDMVGGIKMTCNFTIPDSGDLCEQIFN